MQNRTTYSHIHDDPNALSVAGITVTDADEQGVTVEGTDRSRITWQQLTDAANQDDDVAARPYLAIWRHARGFLQNRPLFEQGIEVAVTDQGTGGAAYAVEVRDASGSYRRDLMAADEGLQTPNRRLAEAEASDIRKRLRS